jgi:diadenosine tetraphosphate (Ap4A) HIT family hydrolase
MSGATTYDDANVFARILRGEIPCKKVHEDAHTLAFEDINPQAPVHTLVIPKGRYVSLTDFAARASDAEQAALLRAILKVVEIKGLAATGYRVLANAGAHGHQEVPHLHFHVFGGRPLGPMLTRA